MSAVVGDESAAISNVTSPCKRFNQYAGKLDATATENGYIPSDQEWIFEMPNLDKSEEIFIYGVDSKQNLLIVKFHRQLTNDDKVCLYASLLYKDGNEIYEFEAMDLVNKVDSLKYRLQGLHIQILSPFRKVRVTFRGILRKTNKDDNGSKYIFTRIRLFWYPLTKVFDFKTDNDISLISKDASTSESITEPSLEDRYEQYGQIKGTIQFENDALKNFYLWGIKSKKFCEDNSVRKTWKRLFAYSKEGHAFHFGVCVDHSNYCSFRFGHCTTGLMLPTPVVETTLTLSNALTIKDAKEFKIFISDNRELNVTLGGQWKHINPFSSASSVQCSNSLYSVGGCVINGNDGGCLLVEEYNNINKEQIVTTLESKVSLFPQNDRFDGLLTPIRGQSYTENLCGGKGSSLSQLAYISNNIKPKYKVPAFEVPNGVVVTTNAYTLFLKQSSIVAEVLCKLQTNVWNNSSDLYLDCEATSSLIKHTRLPLEIQIEIKRSLEEIFGDKVEGMQFAVRSSAVGEDNEDMSAAGQMNSFLGVRGLVNIFAAVMKCWSSQFTHTAVKYKHYYGQLINTPMAVVIQEMVDCDVAGVMFTCNPVDGDPRRVFITANYGLCETVVSGKSEPDTIIVLVDSSNDDTFTIESTQIGSKKYTIKLTNDGENDCGTQESSTVTDEAVKLCLDSSLAIELSKLATFFRRCFGNERDIEWGIKDGKIFILQSRPVTNLEAYSEWEVVHELDHGMRTEAQVLCRCNVGENLPGSISPLGISLWFSAFLVPWIVQIKSYSEQRAAELTCPYLSIAFTIYCNQLFFDLKGKTAFGSGDGIQKRASNISFFGHDMNDEDVERFIARDGQRNAEIPEKAPFLSMLSGLYSNVRSTFSLVTGPTKLRRAIQNAKNYKLLNEDQSFETPKQLFDHMFNSMTQLFELAELHGQCSTVSMNSSTQIITMLCNNNESENEVLHDVSLLLSTNRDVVSVDVPRALHDIAQNIGYQFKHMCDEKALQYITLSATKASEMFNAFLKDHGHRGYKEFDVMYDPWERNPAPLVKLIKHIVADVTPKTEKQEFTAKEIISRLKTKLPLHQRLLLTNFWLPLSQSGVGFREQSKSVLIAYFNEYRKAFHKLSEMIVSEGKLPSSDLLFFLTLEEIPRLFTERDALLVSKARLRKKYFPAMNALQFDEIIRGPEFKARNETQVAKKTIPTGEKVTGTVVCIGQITGRAIVAKCFDDVSLIELNDILITFAIDVGWSPYFSRLAGIITEIGGLISHGAVIAREYGIPCIVGVQNATQLFKTGDRVTLDAIKGIVYKIK